MAKQSKVTLAAVSPDTMRGAALATAKAVVTCEKSKRVLLTAVASAVGVIGQALSAAQYDRQFKPYLSQGFERAVKRGDISQRTADQYGSKLKTAVLAILCKAAEPVAGETFWEFYDRAAQAVTSATLSNGAPVWEVSAKRGRKVGVTLPKKGGALPGVVVEANASAGTMTDAEGGTNENVQLAAARILTKGNMRRAYNLIWAVRDAPEVFDKWINDAMPDAVKAEIGGRLRELDRATAAKAATTQAPKAEGEPQTAMAAALIEGQRKANGKRHAQAA